MKTLWKFLAGSALVLSLSACGLAEKVEEAKNAFSTLSVLMKQGISTEFDEVWVQLKKVEASNDAGDVQSIYDNPAGKTVNLVSPDSVAQLVTAVSLPSNSFQYVDVTFSSNVRVVNKQGFSFSYNLPVSSQDYQVRLPANLELLANKLSSIAVEFDLGTFVPDQLNQVDPAIVLDSNAQAIVDRVVANLEGTVVSVNNGTMTIQPANGSAPITVSLHSAAAVLNELTGQSLSSLASLSINDLVEIYGNYNTAQAQVVAMAVTRQAERLHYGDDVAVTGLTVKAEGVITAIDANVMTLDVKESTFVPSGNTIDVIDFASAVYLHGNQSVLRVGSRVEVKGVWDGQYLLAARVEVEGASRFDDISGDAELAEIEGQVQSVQNNVLRMTVSEVEHANFAIGSTLDIDLTNVWFKKGNSSCLTSGVKVEVKGLVADAQSTNFQANLIEVESGNCATLPESELFDDDSSESDNDTDSSNDDNDSDSESNESDDS